MKCVLCNGGTKKQIVEHKEFGVSLGKFPANVCEKCDETFYDSETAGKIQEKSKKMGLFGLARKSKVAQIGNSIAIRIPKTIAELMDIKKGDEVTLIPKDKRDLLVEI